MPLILSLHRVGESVTCQNGSLPCAFFEGVTGVEATEVAAVETQADNVNTENSAALNVRHDDLVHIIFSFPKKCRSIR